MKVGRSEEKSSMGSFSLGRLMLVGALGFAIWQAMHSQDDTGKIAARLSGEVSTDELSRLAADVKTDDIVIYTTSTLRVSPEVRQQKLDAHEMFLREEVFIEVNDPTIRGLADQLKGPTTRDTARSIYDWERSNLQYSGFIADDLGARYAAKERRGDCTEYAYLAAALARANGIPARVLGGYVVATDAAPRTSDYHNWTEMYVEGAWRLVDAQKDRFFAYEDEYVAMRVASDNAANALGTNHRFAVFGRVQARME